MCFGFSDPAREARRGKFCVILCKTLIKPYEFQGIRIMAVPSLIHERYAHGHVCTPDSGGWWVVGAGVPGRKCDYRHPLPPDVSPKQLLPPPAQNP